MWGRIALAGPLLFLFGFLLLPSGPPIPGMCDTFGAGCAASVSTTRAPNKTYNGKLFQIYNGTTTLDVSTSGAGGVVNTAAIPAFCAGVLNGCLYSGFYDTQSGTLIQSVGFNNGSVGSAAPGQCANATHNECASQYWIDPSTGLPAVVTTFPSEYDTNLAGINGLNNPVSIVWYGRNEQFPAQFGIGHATNAPLTDGTDLILTNYYGSNFTVQPTNYLKCGTATTYCIATDQEASVGPHSPGHVGAAYASGTGDLLAMTTFDGSGATNTNKAYANSSTAAYSDSPPSSTQNGAALLPPSHLKIGCGGDCTQSTMIMRDGFVANTTLGSSDFTVLQQNMTQFYAGRPKAACAGTSDMAYFQPSSNAGNSYSIYMQPTNTYLDYGLFQARASWYGPIADLNNGTSVQTFTGAIAAGSTGCGLDPAAATFCTAGSLGHCTVAKLYLQAMFSTSGLGYPHDTTLDIVFASGKQPTVTFNSLHSLPTMNFTGTQYGCSGTIASSFGTLAAASVVARRNGATAAINRVFWAQINAGATTLQVGFNSVSGQAYFFNGQTLTDSATEAHWHHLYQEGFGAGVWNSYVDGTAGTTTSTGSQTISGPICIGADNAGGNPLTGDVAQVSLFTTLANNSTGSASIETALFSTEQGIWGALPN